MRMLEASSFPASRWAFLNRNLAGLPEGFNSETARPWMLPLSRPSSEPKKLNSRSASEWPGTLSEFRATPTRPICSSEKAPPLPSESRMKPRRFPKLAPLERIEVVWDDALFDPAYDGPVDEYAGGLAHGLEYAGYFVKYTRDAVVVCSCRETKAGHSRFHFAIPKRAVKEPIRRLDVRTEVNDGQ